MVAWRLCRAPHIALTGDGARLHGGRWNSPGRPMVYAAADAALSVLEVRVHLDLPLDLLPEDYVLCCLDLTGLDAETLDDLPADPASFGDTWLTQARTPVLRVPSVLVGESVNLLLNPAHPAAGLARVRGTRRFAFDPRLWRAD